MPICIMMESRYLLAVLVTVFVCATAQCPPTQLITPCNCSGTLIPTVECQAITDIKTLTDVFQRSGDRSFQSFALINSTVMYMPATAIKSKKFIFLSLWNVSMAALFDRKPDEDNEISMIIMNSVIFQRGLRWEFFGPMKKLEGIKAEYTEIKSLKKSFVDSINRGIKAICLMHTKTRYIKYNAFANFKEMTYVEISNSEIQSLSRSMFATPCAIQELNFSGNKIETLPDDIFSDMPALKTIILDNNKITVLSQAVFGDAYHRSGSIQLKGNPVICECEMYWYVSSKSDGEITGTCEAPEDQEGKSLESLTTEDLNYCVLQSTTTVSPDA